MSKKKPDIYDLRPDLKVIFQQMVGTPLSANYFTDNPETRALVEQAKRIAPTNVNISITGETGVGKDVLAKFIHANRKYPEVPSPFIAINCAEFSSDLISSALLGHEKGAFTGAHKPHKGALERAKGGTLFIDEIGELSKSVQITLLRALTEKEIVRIGGENTVKTNFRLITATHRNLEDMVQKGDMREDFYYRIKGLPLHLPALRERPEDIIALSQYFAFRTSKEIQHSSVGISARAMEHLLSHGWHGNIRELQMVIEATTALAATNGGIIEINDLHPFMEFSLDVEGAHAERASYIVNIDKLVRSGATQRDILSTVRKMIVDSADDFYPRKQDAADGLGINRTTYYKSQKKSAMLHPPTQPR